MECIAAVGGLVEADFHLAQIAQVLVRIVVQVLHRVMTEDQALENIDPHLQGIIRVLTEEHIILAHKILVVLLFH